MDEPHKAGDIIEDRIILTDNVWHGENIPTEEELDSIVYDKGYAVRAIKIDLIDDIETRTDMTPYGFTKVDENRYCKTNEAIGWARMECYVNRLPKHKPTEEEMEFGWNNADRFLVQLGGVEMTIENIFQYVMDDGCIGGIIIADSLEEAIEKLKMNTNKRYPNLTGDRAKAIVWSIKDNSNHENDVYEIFNE